MIDYCQSKFKQYADAISFQVGNVTDLNNFSDNYFDLVLFSFNGLDSVEKQPIIQGLSEIKWVCKPGDWLFFFRYDFNMINYFYEPKTYPTAKRQKREDEKRALIIKHNNEPQLILKQDDYIFFDSAFMKFAVNDIIRQYFIKPIAQINQLQNLGFRDFAVFSIETGQKMKDHQELENIQDHWLYYLCPV